MQYAMLNEADGDSSSPRLAKWHSILVSHPRLRLGMLHGGLSQAWEASTGPGGTYRALMCPVESAELIAGTLACPLMPYHGKDWVESITGITGSHAALACMQAAMQLTPKQTASLLEARTCLLARLMEIIQGRKSIISMLKVRITCHNTPGHRACWVQGSMPWGPRVS